MDETDKINKLVYSLTFLTNYFLNNYGEKKLNNKENNLNDEKEIKKILPFVNKPIVTKYINKIVYVDIVLFKTKEEFLKTKKFMNELKKNILDNVNQKEIKKNVLKEILLYKNQQPLFKFINQTNNTLTNKYKKNVIFEYFLKDIFLDESNKEDLKFYFTEIINNINNSNYNIITKENNYYKLTDYSVFIYEKNYNIKNIENNNLNKEIFFEIYNNVKNKNLYFLLLINLALEYKIINFKTFYLLINNLIQKIEILFKEENNFIIEQEINLLSYMIIISKYIMLNTKKNFKKKEITYFLKLYDDILLDKIYSYSNNTYLKFL